MDTWKMGTLTLVALLADSAIILGGKQGDAVNLLGKGDLLYLRGAQLLRLQSLYAPDIIV